MVGIYKIINPTGKVYIGQSWNIANRKSQYKGLHCNGQSPISSSMAKYGWDNHIFQIIHELPEDVSQETLDNYEILYWQQYCDCNVEMLNAKEPGRGGRHSTQTKQQISITKTGSNHKKETIDKIRKSLKGRPPATPRRAVEQYTTEGIFIKSFDSQMAAASSLGVKHSSAICRCCQGIRKTYKGYIWKYKTSTL